MQDRLRQFRMRGVGLCLGLLAVALPALGFQVRGRITRVDAENRRLDFFAQGQERKAQVAADATLLDESGKPLARGLRSEQLKPGAEVTLEVERRDNRPVVRALRLGAGPAANVPAPVDPPGHEPAQLIDMTKVKALPDMGPSDDYNGFKGGLYPGESNQRPAAHEQKGLALARLVRPLDAQGKPSPDGKVVLLAIGFSNTLQCFRGFMEVARGDAQVDPHVVLVNGAVGGMPAEVIQDRESPGGKRYWATVGERLEQSGVTPAQVQVVWLKETDAGPKLEFPEVIRKLQAELARIVKLLPERFGNIKLVYLSSRSWGGWSKRPQANPEPFSYETGFAVKWLIEDQINGKAGMVDDPGAGVRVPWLAWGPYLWANGTTKRSDGFAFERTDYRADDQMHHSAQGMRKMGHQLLNFFKTDTATRGWFVKPAG